MTLGIVGSEAAKFTMQTEQDAKALIHALATDPLVLTIVSGECHLGGINIWAKEEAYRIGKSYIGYPPKRLTWSAYSARNLQIAKASDKVVCITIAKYPESYTGMKFLTCYHCGTNKHVKSGGCWTVKKAIEMGKEGEVIVI